MMMKYCNTSIYISTDVTEVTEIGWTEGIMIVTVNQGISVLFLLM